jgi:hypothetical protein
MNEEPALWANERTGERFDSVAERTRPTTPADARRDPT